MREKKNNRKKEVEKQPLLAQLVFPAQILAFLVVVAEFYSGVSPLMMIGTALIGVLPSFLLLLMNRNYMYTTAKGMKVYHKSISYLFTGFIAFSYMWLLTRSGEFGPISRAIAVPAIILIYYSLYQNLEGKGRKES